MSKFIRDNQLDKFSKKNEDFYPVKRKKQKKFKDIEDYKQKLNKKY